jgi:hypothetical protein
VQTLQSRLRSHKVKHFHLKTRKKTQKLLAKSYFYARIGKLGSLDSLFSKTCEQDKKKSNPPEFIENSCYQKMPRCFSDKNALKVISNTESKLYEKSSVECKFLLGRHGHC